MSTTPMTKIREKKGENWRKGYQAGYEEASKAFGNCKKCYGKGYSTEMKGAIEGAEDFGGEGFILPPKRVMNFCSCGRGKQLESLIRQHKEG